MAVALLNWNPSRGAIPMTTRTTRRLHLAIRQSISSPQENNVFDLDYMFSLPLTKQLLSAFFTATQHPSAKAAVISMLIEHYNGNVRGAVLALGDMLNPPVRSAAREVSRLGRLCVTTPGELRSNSFSFFFVHGSYVGTVCFRVLLFLVAGCREHNAFGQGKPPNRC